MNQFQKVTIEDRVRWSDVDAARIIFYGAYIRFFDIAETELFRAAGFPYSTMFDEIDVWLPRAHIECDFRNAAMLDDILQVEVYVSKIGNKSLHLKFNVRRKGNEELLAEAKFVLVSVDRENFKPVPVPDELRKRLESFTKQESVPPAVAGG